jgi:hypothetical protein
MTVSDKITGKIIMASVEAVTITSSRAKTKTWPVDYAAYARASSSLSKHEARRIAANIAKLPGCCEMLEVSDQPTNQPNRAYRGQPLRLLR